MLEACMDSSRLPPSARHKLGAALLEAGRPDDADAQAEVQRLLNGR
ncbi:MAG: hypothetical protein ACREIT_02320 [Tepidisphaeraceae bacterium]